MLNLYFRKNSTYQSQQHSYHLVDPSPWPFLVGVVVLGLPIGFILFFHSYGGGLTLIYYTLCMLGFITFGWWRDVVREGLYEGKHTQRVIDGLRMGMILFILSEVMFFFAFFWSFFYLSFNASVALGTMWPPCWLEDLNPFHIPLLNTIILLASGASISWSHHSVIYGILNNAVISLVITIIAAIFFTFLQWYEYLNAPFCISDGVYGSIFFLTTGFHGLHVIIGTIFLIICLFRLLDNQFSKEQHVGYEFAIWYWHFVDVVWIFLYFSIYIWGSI